MYSITAIRWLSILGIAFLCPPATAQERAPGLAEQPRCWLGAMSYSPGAKIRAGNEVMVCTPDFAWAPTEQWAAGCVHGGEFYSVGAIQNASSQQQRLSKCLPDGSWGQVTP